MEGEMKRVSVLLGACPLFVGLTVGGNASTVTPYVATVDQVGSSVVVIGSGEFDLAGLSFAGDTWGPAVMFPFYGILQLSRGPGTAYAGLTGPTGFGQNVSLAASDYAGEFVGISAEQNRLYVPPGYTSGIVPTPIAGVGLPGMVTVLAGAGLLGWWRRRRLMLLREYAI
jgi:hypothetical protein